MTAFEFMRRSKNMTCQSVVRAEYHFRRTARERSSVFPARELQLVGSMASFSVTENMSRVNADRSRYEARRVSVFRA